MKGGSDIIIGPDIWKIFRFFIRFRVGKNRPDLNQGWDDVSTDTGVEIRDDFDSNLDNSAVYERESSIDTFEDHGMDDFGSDFGGSDFGGDFGGGGCCWGDVGRRRDVGKVEFVFFEWGFGFSRGGSLLVRYAISWGVFNLCRLTPSVRGCAAEAGTRFGCG